MANSWMLQLETALGAERVVAGLPLATRLALSAQTAGASGVVSDDAQIQALLAASPQLRIAVSTRLPADTHSVSVPANYVVHRDHFRASAQEFARAPNATARHLSHSSVPAFDTPHNFAPIGVVDGATARDAERKLFRALRKPQDGWTSRYLNRYLSLAISRWLVKTPLTPNMVSIAILGVGLAGAWFASRGDNLSLIIGALLFQSQSVLDGCDGEMSRVTYRGSLLGQWLDTIGDDLTNYGFFAGAGWGLFQTTGHWWYLAAALLTVACGGLASAIEYRYLIKIGSGDLLRYPLSESSSSSGWVNAVQPLFKRDTFVFLTLLAALLGQTGPMLLAFAAGAVLIFVSVIRTELRLARAPDKASGGVGA